MESPYPRDEPTRPTGWVVDIVAAFLASAIVVPVLLVLIVPRLGGVFSSLGNEPTVSVSYSIVTRGGNWWFIGVVCLGVIGLFLYLRSRGPSGPTLTVRRVVWLAIGLTFIFFAFVVVALFQAFYRAGDMIK